MVALYCYTGHIRDYINHLRKKNPLVEITLLSNLRPEVIREAIPDTAIKIEWYDVPEVKNIKWRWLRFQIIKYRQVSFFHNFSKNRKYDIVNVHFANRYMSYVYKYLRAMSRNIVMSPWGSDVLRIPKKHLKQLSYLYENADYILSSLDIPLGKKILQEFKVNPQKMVGNFWGTNAVDYAIKKGDSISQEESKRRFGLTGRYVITCGYNRQESQRHKVIIKAIDQVRGQLPENLTLLFPMNYGSLRAKYVEDVEMECKKRSIHSVFITDYLSEEDLYKLRKATDMFVHVQTTDANSGSVQEYILCNKKIVHGSWIKYEIMESFSPLFYFPVDNLDNLGEVIVKAYESDNIAIPQGVIDCVKNSGWESKSTKMNDFFMSIV